jgi:uncharacterized protein (UPF0128 family)
MEKQRKVLIKSPKGTILMFIFHSEKEVSLSQNGKSVGCKTEKDCNEAIQKMVDAGYEKIEGFDGDNINTF